MTWSEAMPDRRLFLGDCLDGMASLCDQSVDHCIIDAPYSDRIHHDGRNDTRSDGGKVTVLGYEHWTPDDVRTAAHQIARVTRGWVLSITDHILWPTWAEALGRYSFHPIPIIIRGMTVRMLGDGPSSWALWMVANRPIGFPLDGTKDGAYVGDPGERASNPVKGHKPTWLMDRLICDYTKPGQVVLDPCMGSGQTALAAIRWGRKFVGMERDGDTFELARKRIESAHECLTLFPAKTPQMKQALLLK